ncbi:MAG: transporter substrate-binding domain-containing protein [Negativicutes bacterium]
MKKLLFILLAIIIVAAAVTAYYLWDPNKIIVGIDNNPPYTFINQPVSVNLDTNGNVVTPVKQATAYIGFDIDVIEAAAKKAGLNVEYRNLPFGEMIDQIERGKKINQYLVKSSYTPAPAIDIAIGGISVTDARKKLVDFTIPYAKGGACILTTKGSRIYNANDLSGKTVGVELGTTMIAQANATKGVKLKGYHSQTEMYIDLYNGDLDAIVMDRMAAEYCLKDRKMNQLRIVNMPSTEEFAMVLKKGNKPLNDKLNKALMEMQQSGELKMIYDKWFTRLQP